MAFQPVPPQTDLQASIPAGRTAVAIRTYAKPTPAFGPGSESYVQQMAEELGKLQVEEEDEAAETTTTPPSHPSPSLVRAEGNYAGAGQYF